MTGNREGTYWKEESIYATLPTTGLKVLKNCVITPNVVQNWEEVNNDGSGSNLLAYEVGTEDVQFNLEWNPQTFRELVLAIGDATNSSVSTYYSHVFSQNADKSLTSFSVQRVQNHSSTDVVETFSGCKFNNTTLSWSTGGGGTGKFLKMSGDVLASTYSVAAAFGTPEVSAPSVSLYQSRQASLTINNVAIAECIGGSITWESNLNDSWYGGQNRSEMNPTFVRVRGQVMIHYSANTVPLLFKARAAISNCSVVFTRTATSDIATFPLTGMVISKCSAPTKIQDINVMTIDFNCPSCLPTVTDARDDY
ncbi:MAG: phage tail tube protein [Candidatus Nanoarchaeia archaeon]